jgi:BirA family transcriptional regulator, biotin operon repressor / biotin---[acetyl-CoA-carboxylase] ligase
MVTGMLDAGARTRLAATRFADVRWFAEIDSTNRYLLDEARAGAPDGVVAVANHQTAGRGRLGRSWTAPAGASLLFSVLLRPRDLPLDRLHLLTAAVSLSAAEACWRVAGVRPGLKWPNDLVSDDSRKVAGVLAESLLAGGAVNAVVVGVGMNVNWPPELPPELADIAVSVNQLAGHEVDRSELLVETLLVLEAKLNDWDVVAREYRRACVSLNRRVRIELPDETFVGNAADVTDDGHLLVDVGACLRTVTAGDVVHLRPA